MLNRLAWKESVYNPVKMLSKRELTLDMQAGRISRWCDMPRFGYSPGDVFADAGWIVSFAPTGKQVIIADIIITRIQTGKAVELWAQFDALGLRQQLGVYRPQGRGVK